MRYTMPECPASGSPRVEYQVSHPHLGVVLVQRRSGDGPWQDVMPSDLRIVLGSRTDLAAWLRDAMARPAHRPRRDPSAARVVRSYRVHPDTARLIADAAASAGISQGQVVDQMAHGLGPS